MARVIAFGDYRFDADSGELTGPGGVARLQPQPAKVLAALLARPGELVTRDELKALVWPDTVVESDQGLNFCIRQIRSALGDEAESGRFIETLPRRGYRFVATLGAKALASEATDSAQVPETTAEKDVVVASTALRGSSARIWAIVPVILVVIVAITTWRNRDHTLGARRPLRVAVFPLTAPSGEVWMNELDRAITDHVVEQLTNAPEGWGVIGPVTTSQYTNDTRPHTELATLLGVDLVVSGGIRTSDSTLFVQGIRASDGVHIFAWRERVWDRPEASIAASLLSKLSERLRSERPLRAGQKGR